MPDRDPPDVSAGIRRDYCVTPPPADASRARLLHALRAAPPPRRGFDPRRPILVRISPLAGIAAALLLVAAGALATLALRDRARAPMPPASISTPVEAPVVRFELLAPNAERVALVGDFNDWDAGATPMRRIDGSGRWSVSLPITAGRHVYAFVVDGRTWVGDPAAPRAPDEGFGAPNSVIVVGAGETTS